MTRVFTSLLAVSLSMAGVGAADAKPRVSTAEIVAQAFSAQCLDYNPVRGLCVWLDCGLSGCGLKTSLKIRHYTPDLVLSAYHETGENPWTAVQPLTGQLARGQGGGLGTESRQGRHSNLRFKHVDVFGHPATGFYGWGGFTCPSVARPFRPHFVSSIDPVGWRLGVPEMFFPSALIPGRREIRGVLAAPASWGALYPRIGFVVQAHDYKAGAVAGLRAANIVTRWQQPHVYVPALGAARDGYWPPGAVREDDPTTARWQRLLPESDGECGQLADIDDLAAGALDPYAERLSEAGDYAWAVWRPYECCADEGGVLLYDVTF